MHSYRPLLTALLATAGLALASPASAQVVHCFNFEAPPVGTAYPVGAVLAFPGVDFVIAPFQDGAGGWTGAGDVNIVLSNHAMGSPVQEARVDNVTLAVNLTPAADGLRFRYADLGGNVNFEVNGDFRNVPDLSMLDGLVIGGHPVSVTWVGGGGGEHGTLTVSGQGIFRVRVGGQEFFIDDLCYRQ
jgi:hypothetical protein